MCSVMCMTCVCVFECVLPHLYVHIPVGVRVYVCEHVSARLLCMHTFSLLNGTGN